LVDSISVQERPCSSQAPIEHGIVSRFQKCIYEYPAPEFDGLTSPGAATASDVTAEDLATALTTRAQLRSRRCVMNSRSNLSASSVDAELPARRWRRADGLSLADRLCQALGERLEANTVTADTEWVTAGRGRIHQIR